MSAKVCTVTVRLSKSVIYRCYVVGELPKMKFLKWQRKTKFMRLNQCE